MLQEKPGKVFFRKLGSRLDIIISLHFYNIYDILQPEKFCDDKNAPNSAFRRDLWRSFRVPSRLGRGILSPHSPPRHLEFGGIAPRT